MGVESELWLGETDGVAEATALMNDVDSAVAALSSIQKQLPGLTGYNFDLELAHAATCGSERCDKQFAAFLQGVRAGIAAATPPNAPVPRVTADVDCSEGDGWSPIMSNCTLLSSSADKAMNMGTYDASSYKNW